MTFQDAINAIRKGDPLKHDTIQEIGDMLEDLLMTNKERGEKIGRLRNRIETEEAINFHLEASLESSHELLCILRTTVESCDEDINSGWSYEELGKKVHTLLLSEEVYEDLHVENERALIKAKRTTHGGSVGND